MAPELNLGLDSFVFVDDNPAEIEIVRQFVPEVTTILLGPDPADYRRAARGLPAVRAAQHHRVRMPSARSNIAPTRSDKTCWRPSPTWMPTSTSLQMEAAISEFTPVDVPRLSQLINKSNQFNLTTRRRTEAEVIAVMNDPNFIGYSMRLEGPVRRPRFDFHRHR